MKSLIVLLSAVLMLSACDSMKQDPLDGASDRVRNGQLPDASKPVSESPYPKEALQIDSPSVVNGRVGSPVEFQVTGRVALQNVGFKLSVPNLADFPGATFNTTTGLFSWVPPKNTVGSAPSAEFNLKLNLVTEATAQNPVIATETKNVVLVIVNSYAKPMISFINGSTDLQAGYRASFDFEVEDQDALNEKEIRFGIRDCSGYSIDSIAHFIDLPASLQKSPTAGKFTGKLTLNLSTGVDALVSGRYCFALVAVSKFGVESETYKKEVYIEARVKNTKITNSVADIPMGQVLRFGFSIYDPSGNGVITIQSLGDLAAQLPGSSVTCNPSMAGVVDCVAFVNATNAQPGAYITSIVTENKAPRFNQTTTTTHTLRVNVKAL